MMLSKRIYIISWLPKSSSSWLIAKAQDDSDMQVLEKKIEDVKKMPNTSGLVKKTDCNTKITEIENKIPSLRGLVTTTMMNTKATEIENKISDTTNLAIKAALNTKAAELESKIPVFTNLAIKAALNAKTTEIENKIPDAKSFITIVSKSQVERK